MKKPVCLTEIERILYAFPLTSSTFVSKGGLEIPNTEINFRTKYKNYWHVLISTSEGTKHLNSICMNFNFVRLLFILFANFANGERFILFQRYFKSTGDCWTFTNEVLLSKGMFKSIVNKGMIFSDQSFFPPGKHS